MKPPTEDRCVQFGINCPFKWREAFRGWRLQTVLLYTMFPAASNEHNLSLEGTTVLQSKSINTFRNQTQCGSKKLFLFSAPSVAAVDHTETRTDAAWFRPS